MEYLRREDYSLLFSFSNDSNNTIFWNLQYWLFIGLFRVIFIDKNIILFTNNSLLGWKYSQRKMRENVKIWKIQKGEGTVKCWKWLETRKKECALCCSFTLQSDEFLERTEVIIRDCLGKSVNCNGNKEHHLSFISIDFMAK